MSSPYEISISRLSLLRDESLGSGRFGTVFPGKLKDVAEEVAIKKMAKIQVKVETSLYSKSNGQPNLIGYYGIAYSSKDDEFM